MITPGCKRTPVASLVPSADQALLELATARPVPAALRSRFGFKLQSEAFSGSTGGALVTDRPGNGHLAVLSPLGGALLTLHTDGQGLAVVDKRNRSHGYVPDAESTLRDATEGLAGLDEVLGLLVGDLPIDGLKVTERSRTPDGDLALGLAGPRQTTVALTLDDPLGTPVALSVTDRDGQVLLTADYGPFEVLDAEAAEPTYMPSEVSVAMARFGVSIDVRFKRWHVLTGDVPDVFGLDAPDGFTSFPLDLSKLVSEPTQ